MVERSNYPKASYHYHHDLGYYSFTTHRTELSISSFEQALEIALEHSWIKEAIKSKIWLANHHLFQNEIAAARSTYNQVLQESKAIDYIDGIATGYYGLSSVEKDQEKILQLLIKVDSLYQRRKLESPVLANSYGMIAEIYLESYKDKETANKYFTKAIEVALRTNYIPYINHMANRLGKMAFDQGNYQEAYKYFNELLDQSTQAFDTINLAHGLVNLASVDYATKNWEKAEERILTAMAIYEEFKDSTSLANTNLTLANLYITRKNVPKAKQHLDRANSFPNKIAPSEFRIDFLRSTVAYLKLTNDYKNALQKQQELDSLKTTQLDEENGKAFLELEQKYQADEKEQEIELLTAQKELIEQQNTNQRNLFLGGGAILAIAVIGLLLLYRNKQKTNDRLKELDLMKSNFFANISHEFRTPLTLISGPIQLKLDDDQLPPKDRSDFERIYRNNQRLLALVDQLLDLSKIEAGSLKLQVENGDLLKFIGAIADSFTYATDQKQIEYLLNIHTNESQSWFDTDAIEKIVVNLLSNAVKYAPEKGTVSCNARIENDWLSIVVKNTGKGLTREQLKKVFERFYQADTNQAGTGVGLALIKELVSLHKGNVSVKSEPNGWTSFAITLPIGKKAYNAGEFKVIAQDKPLETLPEAIDTFKEAYTATASEELPILLVVEDNEDVMSLLYDTFENGYNVITANNGDQGVQLAIEQIPDLIISDVMMPVMDGIELTELLKNDERTSHIPIILLTAKAGEENELMGIETGADDYITKPFSNKILIAKVAKLIELRKKLQSRYSQEVILKPKDIAITNLDEQFLGKTADRLGSKALGSLLHH